MASPLRIGAARHSNGRNSPEDVRRNSPEDVRRTLARELHDRVAQTLTSMLIEMENFKLDQKGNESVVTEVIGLQESTREVLNSIRHVLYDLRGHDEMEESFVDAVRALLARFQERTQVKAVLSISPSWPATLRPSVALNLLRIIEEALTNVRMHSGARSVQVALCPAGDGGIQVEVTDDGRGTDSDIGQRAPGLGVMGMRERALILGGRLVVEAAAGGGTSVRAIIPKELLT